MKIFLSYRGPGGGASRKILGEYNLPSAIGLDPALINAGVCGPLSDKYKLTPGALFDLAHDGLCRSSPAIAALLRPGVSVSSESAESHHVTKLQQEFRSSFSRIERAVFEMMPLTSQFFEPERLALIPESELLLGGPASCSSIEGPAGLSEALSGEYDEEIANQQLEISMSRARHEGRIGGLLLSFDPGRLPGQYRSSDAWHDASATAHLETQLGRLVGKPLERRAGFNVSGEFVLYPDVEKGNDTQKWQTWLRAFLQCVGYGLFTKRISVYSDRSSKAVSRTLFPTTGVWSVGRSQGKTASRLFRGGGRSPPAASRDLIKRIDELSAAEKKRIGGAIPRYVPVKGGLLSLYMGLSSIAELENSICSLPHTNGACGDCG
jgi:hypothetical protein